MEHREDRSSHPSGDVTTKDAGHHFQRLVDIVAELRGPAGCPWDRAQTVRSLRPFVLEETYEVLEAIDQGEEAALREEIGDYFFEGVFLAQIEAEAGRFSVADTLQAVVDKLVRRHPHVFARAPGVPQPTSAGEVVERWEELKARERNGGPPPRTLLSGIPPALPALLQAFQIGSRAAAVGFDWLRAADVIAKVEEEVTEVRQAIEVSDGDTKRVEEELGDLLFAVVNLSRKLRVEPEAALRAANRKFTARFGVLEQRLQAQGRRLQDATLEEMEVEWEKIKTESQQ